MSLPLGRGMVIQSLVQETDTVSKQCGNFITDSSTEVLSLHMSEKTFLFTNLLLRSSTKQVQMRKNSYPGKHMAPADDCFLSRGNCLTVRKRQKLK